MASLLEKIMRDAQQLVGKIKQNENKTDNIINQYQTLQNKVDDMKKYQDVSGNPAVEVDYSNQHLDLSLLPENQQIKDLEAENEELKNHLEEHQTTLELIMSKYRQHINKHLNNQVLTTSVENKKHLQNIELLQEKIISINDMGEKMWQALECDNEPNNTKVQLTQLQKEFYTLKQLLEISRSFGNNCIFDKHKLELLYEHKKPVNCFENDQNISFIENKYLMNGLNNNVNNNNNDGIDVSQSSESSVSCDSQVLNYSNGIDDDTTIGK